MAFSLWRTIHICNAHTTAETTYSCAAMRCHSNLLTVDTDLGTGWVRVNHEVLRASLKKSNTQTDRQCREASHTLEATVGETNLLSFINTPPFK